MTETCESHLSVSYLMSIYEYCNKQAAMLNLNCQWLQYNLNKERKWNIDSTDHHDIIIFQKTNLSLTVKLSIKM